MPRIELYDTTLRDGAQTEGISYSVQDKLRITEKLDGLGVQYIEGGWPGSNPKDAEFFRAARRLRLKTARLAAFGSTRRAVRAANDANLKALLKADTAVVTIFGKSWDLHVRDVLKIGLEDNLTVIEDSVGFLKRHGRLVIFDAEHFFDGYKENRTYALKTLQAALTGGADAIVFCDTNGGSLPDEITEIINASKPGLRVPLGIHAHNDSDLAVANSIAAVRAGVSQIQGTMNGYGERCGNANLVSLVGILKLKMGLDCLPDARFKELTETSRYVAEVSNMAQRANQPFVGEAAFAHKGGVHVNAVLKNPRTYEHIEPSTVGNERKILVSELSGRSSLVFKAKGLALDLSKETPEAKRLLKLLQQLEHQGYHFEAAEGSLELLLKRELKQVKPFFTLDRFRVIMEKRDRRLVSEATIKVRVNGVPEQTAAEGDGPVNALDNAIRKALKRFYPTLAEMHLTDFKVRVLNEKAGTAAKVRVLIQSQDAHDSWGTVGVSENIIEASWQALADSIEYKLLKDQRSASSVQRSGKKPRLNRVPPQR
ncbi:MAG: citramalate synthase [Candidatus Omnitrophica bacterium]|nr:citramalate synthase [Candidatus Omnitrophota bacterium]MBI3020964.1 citramalate synthase [Candidatus Omnitrophota bacterium]MBI3083835.1 citramalate synthase [Candidatus Omnitrophota bacterium]